MAFTRENSIGNAIHSYAPGEIQILQNTLVDGSMKSSVTTLNSNFIINSTDLITDWVVHDSNAITAETITPIIILEPEIVIFGVGAKMQLPSVTTNLLFQKYAIGLEVMDTAAACRTYNFLLTEGRNVVAALIQIKTE